MANSKYPDKIDTSIEIPAVRDNIVEIGSDVINSIRSAIFNIERTLGINPQGAVGNTVSSRLNKSLDSNGNISKEALDRAGIVSGPISNKDISRSAGISEEKLNLYYPTRLLQEEISQIHYQIKILDETLDGLSALYATHVHPAAKGRHPATAISVSEITSDASSDAVTSYELGDVQDLFGKIFSSHINYDGSNISEENRSHKSNQVFFDNSNTSTYITSSDAQGAIEDVLSATLGQLDDHQEAFHSNSIERSSKTYSTEDPRYSTLLVSNQPVSFSSLDPSSEEDVSLIFFVNPISYSNITIKKSDLAVIINGENELNLKVEGIILSSDGLQLEGIRVYGRILENSIDSATLSIYKNKIQESDFSELLMAVREYQSITSSSYSNADIIQISNKNAATILSSGIKPKEISLNNRSLKISVDSGSDVSFDLYDGAAPEQNIETILKRLNEQIAENRLSIMGYRVDYDDYRPSEIALVHRLSNTEDVQHTIEVKRGTDDALDSLGFADAEGFVFTKNTGRNNYISGSPNLNFHEIFNESGLTLVESTSEIGSYDVNPIEAGVRVGHLITLRGTPSDDGTYVIKAVNSDSIIVDKNQLPSGRWSSVTAEDAKFIVLDDSVSLHNMAFETAVSAASASTIIEIFLNENQRIGFNRRLSYERVSYIASDSIISPCNFEGKTEVYTTDAPGLILAEKAVSDPANKEILISLDGGSTKSLIEVKNSYIDLRSGKHNLKIRVFIQDSDLINSKIISDGSSLSVSLYGNQGVGESGNLLLGKAHYEAAISRVTGFGADYPRTFSEVRRGSIGIKDIGSDTRRLLEVIPHLEKRSNGVINGLEILSVTDNGTTYTASISGGTCYVKGKRFEVPEISEYITDVETGGGPTIDKFYIAIDEWGHPVFSPADPISCGCTLDPYSFCIIGSVEYSSVITTYDLRLFLDNLDYKLLNAITVSPQPGMGHFTDFGKALKYAKRFHEIFPEAGTPTVHLKSGVHKAIIDYAAPTGSLSEQELFNAASKAGLWINFPVNIIGEGHSSVLDIYDVYSDLSYNFETDKDSESRAIGGLTIAGSGLSSFLPEENTDTLSSGQVSISSLRLDNSRIYIYDPTTKDSDGNKLNFNIKLENIIFDSSSSDFSMPTTSSIWITKTTDVSNSEAIGNISILNSEFLNSNIFINASPDLGDEDLRNINISHNIFRGKGIDSSGGEDNYAIHSNSSLSLLDLERYPPYCNINIYGNILADNDADSSEPHFDNSEATIWGDRVNRNLYIGGNVGIGTSSPDSGLQIVDGALHVGPHNVGDNNFRARIGDRNDGAIIVGEKDGYHLSVSFRGMTSRQGDFMSSDGLYLNYDGGGPVKISTFLSSEEYDEEALIVHGKTELSQLDINSPNERPALLNIGVKTDTDRPGLYIGATNQAETGDILTYSNWALGTHNALSLGAYDFSESTPSNHGTFFHEKFRFGGGANGGLLHIFSNDERSNAGIWLHKHGTHNGDNGTNTAAWRIHYRDDDSYPNALGFWYENEDDGHSQLEGFLQRSGSADALDFTGQHRSSSEQKELYSDDSIGMIVSSSGEYSNLDLSLDPKINEAIPKVILSSLEKDKSVFGVISNKEDSDEKNRHYAVGTFVSVFKKEEGDQRLIINSVGEGAIWITNVNGDLENGDYITSSNIPGYGMRQDDDLLHNYTVAKITCDCNFDLNSTIYKCEEFIHNGTTYKRAFVGCTYHCG